MFSNAQNHCEICGVETDTRARGVESGTDRCICRNCLGQFNEGLIEKYAFYHVSQVPGAISNGARVRKIVFMDGDGHPVGAKGTILGSVGPAFVPELGREVYGYFIEWDEGPGRGLPCFVSDFKIAPEEGK